MVPRFPRVGCAFLLIAGTALHADPPAANPAEDALRTRVKQFYSLLVEKKYREAEQLVAPESRDYYYDNEKPKITDFAIQAIAWEDNQNKANVTLVSNFKLRTPRGEYESKLPYVTHWERKDGQWFWYFEKQTVRSSVFGPMRVNPEEAKKSGLNVSEMIAKGPRPEQFEKTVKADRNVVTVSGADPAAHVFFTSVFPGTVKLSARILSGTGFDAEIKTPDLPVNGKTDLVITRRPGEKIEAGHISVVVNPTSQMLDIAVN